MRRPYSPYDARIVERCASARDFCFSRTPRSAEPERAPLSVL
jgi:hypothetical protein